MTEIAPEGYALQACETINATILMPAGWIFWESTERADEYFAVREKLEYNGDFMYETGFTLGAIRNVHRRSIHTAAHVARRHAENPPPEEGFQPVNNLEIVEQGQQTIFRRQHATEGGITMGLHLAPRSYYLAGICINGRDTAYLATFEAPAIEWETYRPIAQVMIESIEIR